MKKQAAAQRKSSDDKTSREEAKFLSLRRQTYEPYLNSGHGDDHDETHYDPTEVVKFAY